MKGQGIAMGSYRPSNKRCLIGPEPGGIADWLGKSGAYKLTVDKIMKD